MKGAVISLGSKSSKWIVQAMKKYFDVVEDISIKGIEVGMDGKKIRVLCKGEPLEKYDCVLIRGSSKYANLTRAVTIAIYQDCYVPIRGSAFTVGHDKFLTHLKLQIAGIAMPKTYLAATSDSAKNILKKVNYPIVMKLPSGTHGKGVMFADSYESASSMLDTLAVLNQPFLIQEYIETGGSDTRALVIGDKVVAAIKRKAIEGEKRSNIHAGGSGKVTVLDAHTKKIALEAAKAVGAEICAIDLLETVKGPKVIEVNLSPGLQGITKITKIDIADKIARYLAEKTKSIKKTGIKSKASEIFTELGITEPETDTGKEILTQLDMRGNRILLPEVITNMAKFNEKGEYVLKVKKGKLVIEESDIGK